MPKTHYIIPIFLPEEACPNRCIYCNQYKITGKISIPSFEETQMFIVERLKQIPFSAENIQIAFFGGNFSGLDIDIQKKFLEIAQYFVDNDRVGSIRLSTRPDYISVEILDLFSRFAVKNIELGAQTFNDSTLEKIGRGHTANQIVVASELIKKYGFSLGLQMMIGLPEEDLNSAIFTANEIVRLGADETRIYPLQVLTGTELENQYKNGLYKPLSLEETIEILVPLVEIFENQNVKILRIGLHPIDETEKATFIAGPFHESLSQMVYTELWFNKLKFIFENLTNPEICIFVSPNQLPNVVGYKQKNKIRANNPNLKFKINRNLKNMEYEIAYS